MERVGYDEADIVAMEEILAIFFSRWNSGGAVWAMAPVVQSLIAGTPLSPLTGEPDEWNDVSEMCEYPTWQNKRCTSVFKTEIAGKVEAYDVGCQGRPVVTFPYLVKNSDVADPMIQI